MTALRTGFRSVARNWGLVLLVLLVNLALALVVAVPLALRLEGDLVHREASRGMMYGFDYDWWQQWSARQEGPPSALSPDLLGTGFAFRNLELLLKGALPAGLFARGGRGSLDPTLLGLGALYLLLQVFLTGGLLGVFRAPTGGWTVRGLVHGSGFYFGRLFRVGLLALAAAGVVFALYGPFARWVDGLAREAVSERTAIALTLGRHAVLLLALVVVHMVSSHAKVLVVREERLSPVLAWLSSLGFCARNFLAGLRPVRRSCSPSAPLSWPSSAPSTGASPSSAGGARSRRSCSSRPWSSRASRCASGCSPGRWSCSAPAPPPTSP